MSGDAHPGWQGAAVAAALGATGLIADLFIVRSEHVSAWPNLVGAALLLCLLILLVGGGRGRRFSAVAFVLTNVVIVWTLFVSDTRLAHTVPGWTPFRPHQLGILAVALLAPPALWAGIASMALFVGSAIVEWILFGPELRSQMPPGQMTILGIYTLFGGTLLVYRLRGLAAERARVRAQTEAAALQRQARTLLAVRDLANTPLQTLEISVALLRSCGADTPVVIDRIERAVAALREVQRVLASFDEHLRWEQRDEGFDSRKVLEAAGRLPEQEPR